jgi:hypothetical protein
MLVGINREHAVHLKEKSATEIEVKGLKSYGTVELKVKGLKYISVLKFSIFLCTSNKKI